MELSSHLGPSWAKNLPAIDPLKHYTLEESYHYCQLLAQSHYENFPVASVAIPKKIRKHIAAVYAFARCADDFADEAEFTGKRIECLEWWQKLLHDSQQPSHPIFVALHNTIRLYGIPLKLFDDLLLAFLQDVNIKRYDSFDELLSYCCHSANPVGRIILHLFGYRQNELMLYSDSICTALQLTNFWQDVSVDLLKDRIYIPQNDLKQFQLEEADLFERRNRRNFEQLMAFQVERTQTFFDHGKPLTSLTAGRLGFELRLTWLGGTGILKKIAKNGYDTLDIRPKLTKWSYVGFIAKALVANPFKSLPASAIVF